MCEKIDELLKHMNALISSDTSCKTLEKRAEKIRAKIIIHPKIEEQNNLHKR